MLKAIDFPRYFPNGFTQVLAVTPTLVTLAPLPSSHGVFWRRFSQCPFWKMMRSTMIRYDKPKLKSILKFRATQFFRCKQIMHIQLLGCPMRCTAVKNTWVDQLRFSQRSCSGRLSWCMEHPWKNGGRTASQLPIATLAKHIDDG